MTVAAKVGAQQGPNRVPEILFQRAPVLLGRVEQEISEYLQPRPDGALGYSGSEQQRHLVAVLVAEVARIETQKPPIDSF
jgi:hypothetical protein